LIADERSECSCKDAKSKKAKQQELLRRALGKTNAQGEARIKSELIRRALSKATAKKDVAKQPSMALSKATAKKDVAKQPSKKNQSK